jgi:L-alanine-DL-glutamate epimerase-like enolase superfamily enzyme
LNRRQLLNSTVVGMGSWMSDSLLAPVQALAAVAKPVRIKTIDTFDIVVPLEGPAATAAAAPGPFNAATNRLNVTRVETDSGVRGYSFGGSTPESVKAAREVLLGQDLFSLEQHLKRGLILWSAVEEAMWDAIGKIAGQPVSRLLGAKLTSVPVYLTYVWPGEPTQDHVPFKDQAAQAVKVKNAGFKAMKVRVWRKNAADDARACAEMLAATGPDFRVMVDRTAAGPGLWDYPAGLAAAQALEAAGVYWLEEPFDRNDFLSPARLAREMEKIIITGGEGYRGLAPFRECLMNNTYEILQPELRTVGGIFMLRKVGVLAETWGVPIAPHAAAGLRLAGRLQVSAAMGSVYQEIGVLTPPLLPDDIAVPALKILRSKNLYTFKNGEIQVPQSPGLGLDIDEDAVNRFRVEGFITPRGGQGRSGRRSN